MVETNTYNEHHEGVVAKKDGLAELETSVAVDATKDKLAEAKEDPTLTGMSNAKENLAKAIREDNPEDAREAMLLLRAYSALGTEQSNRIYNALHALSINGATFESFITEKDCIDTNGKTTALGYAVALYLKHAGYIEEQSFQKVFAYDLILEKNEGFPDWIKGEQSAVLKTAIKKHEQFFTVRNTYKDRYNDGYIYTDADNNALYDKLVSWSKVEREGWLVSAERLPLIRKLHTQTSAPENLNVLLDDNPNNNTQELMFLHLYLLVDREHVQHNSSGAEPVIPGSGKATLPRLDGSTDSKALLINPGAGYEKALLSYAGAFVDQKSRAPEQLSYEAQLATLESTIHRLVVASDVADPEKKGENIDHNLEYSIEEKMITLYLSLPTSEKDDLYESMQNILKKYITGHLFKHTTQTGRFAKLVSLLDAENQKEILLAYTQLEPNFDRGLLDKIINGVDATSDVISPVTINSTSQSDKNNSDDQYVSPLAVGPVGKASLKQFGDEYIDEFSNLSHLSLDDLGGLYTQLLQIIGGKKLDGTLWNTPILDKAFNTVDSSGGLLPGQNKMLGLSDSMAVTFTDKSINFVDPRLSFLFHVQDIYLMKLMESGDDASREKAVDFALALSKQTGGNDVEKEVRKLFIQNIDVALGMKYMSFDKENFKKEYETSSAKFVKDIFTGQKEYKNMKTKPVSELFASIDDNIFTNLVGTSKEKMLDKTGNVFFSSLSVVDQIMLYSLLVGGAGWHSLLATLMGKFSASFEKFFSKNGDKLFSFNEKGMTAKEKQLHNHVNNAGFSDIDSLVADSLKVMEAGIVIPGWLKVIGKYIGKWFKFGNPMYRKGKKIRRMIGLGSLLGYGIGATADRLNPNGNIFLKGVSNVLRGSGVFFGPIGALGSTTGYLIEKIFFHEGAQPEIIGTTEPTMSEAVKLELNMKRAFAFNPPLQTEVLLKEDKKGALMNIISLIAPETVEEWYQKEMKFQLNGSLVMAISPDYVNELNSQIVELYPKIKEYKYDPKNGNNLVLNTKGPLSIKIARGGEPVISIKPPKFNLFLAMNLPSGDANISQPPVIEIVDAKEPNVILKLLQGNIKLSDDMKNNFNEMQKKAQEKLVEQLTKSPDYHKQLQGIFKILTEQFASEFDSGGFGKLLVEKNIRLIPNFDEKNGYSYSLLTNLSQDADNNGKADALEKNSKGAAIDVIVKSEKFEAP